MALCNITSKINCVFNTTRVEVPSKKRSGQSFSVIVSDSLSQDGRSVLEAQGIPTEKVDGTPCMVKDGRLLKRQDRRPSEAGTAKFTAYEKSLTEWQAAPNGNRPQMVWDLGEDWRPPPDGWIPADAPGDAAHWVGWLACSATKPDDKWHLSALTADHSHAHLLVQRGSIIQVEDVPLQQLEGMTFELIGPKVQGNLYGLPAHCLMRHGSIRFTTPPPTTIPELRVWFESDLDGAVEGIVWHSAEHGMVKVHRHHLGLPWPLKDRPTRLRLAFRPDTDSVTN
jgi:hypothetical protein